MSERLDVSMQFNGKAEDAARLYGDVFGKQASIMKFKEFPTFDQMENVEPVAVGRAEIIFDNANLILTDCTTISPLTGGLTTRADSIRSGMPLLKAEALSASTPKQPSFQNCRAV